MQRLIEKIAAAYNDLPLKSMVVPEWETTIYYKPLTGEELDTVYELVDRSAVAKGNVQTVILKALDETGARVFKNDDLETLCSKAFIGTINRIASAMTEVVTPEQAEKN